MGKKRDKLKGKMVNNFPTTTLMKNRFALKGRMFRTFKGKPIFNKYSF